MNRKELHRLLAVEPAREGEADDTAVALAIRSFIVANPGPAGLAELTPLFRLITSRRGLQKTFNLLKRLEVALGFRKPTMAVYDHNLHFIGGAQKYGCTIANALQDDFDITLLANKPVSRHDLQNWYHLDLSGCRIVNIPIPFFEKQHKEHLDPAAITSRKMANPFHLISLESGRYDFFINNGMVEMVYPMTDFSFYVCHFPERRPNSYFYVDRYRHLICNSRYTAEWMEKKWKLRPDFHIYPPVDMNGDVNFPGKEKIILSAARFDPGGNKQQLRMVSAFKEMSRRQPQALRGWKLILAGGSSGENPYLQSLRQTVRETNLTNVEFQVNISAGELHALYQRAKIFWHLCGLNQDEPQLVEHFGMTVVEAMQNGCVPVVFAGGGLLEIVVDNVSGLLFSSRGQLIIQTLKLVTDRQLLQHMAEKACQRGKIFDRAVFSRRVKEIFSKMLQEYRLDR